MAYRLYLNDFNTVKSYDELCKMPKEKQQREKYYYEVATPLRFYLSDKLKDSFKIEEIDSLLCGYKNESDFINELKKHNVSYLTSKEKNNKHLTLAYKAKRETKEAPIIFDDLLLFEQATNLRSKLNVATKDKKILTDNSNRLLNYIEFIKSLAMNKTTHNFLLKPMSIPYLDNCTASKLNIDIFNDKYINKTGSFGEETKVKVNIGLRTLLEEYVTYKKLYDENMRYGESVLSVERELNRINDKINLFFRSDYRNLRKMIEWEEKYKEVLISSLENNNIDSKQKNIIKLQIKKLNLEKEYRNGRISFCETLYIDEEEEYYSEISLNEQSRPKRFQNQQIAELYKEGGIEAVMEGMDLDQILSYTDDAIELGIIKRK